MKRASRAPRTARFFLLCRGVAATKYLVNIHRSDLCIVSCTALSTITFLDVIVLSDTND